MKRRDEVIVGVFVTFAVVIAIVGTLWLARRGFAKSYPMYARFTWGNNLKTGQPVLLAGVQVGYVDDVNLNPAGYLDVTMSIDRKWKIPEGTTATVQNEGFFGDKSVGLHPCRMPQPKLGAEAGAGVDTSAPPVPPGSPGPCRPGAFYPPGDTIPTGTPAPSMDQILARVDSMSGALSTIVQALRVQMVQKGGLEDLRKTIASTNTLMRSLTQVADEQSKQLSATMASLRRTTNAIDSAAVDSTVRGMAHTTQNLAELTTTLKQTTARLDTVMAKMNDGNGTVGRFLNDPGVYLQLRTLLARMDSLTADIKAHPNRYINVKVF